jgi:predicted nucleic acid-binding protein
MKIYLDNCCFNRPFDDQNQVKIKIETEAKLYIQKLIVLKKIELVWSYILEYENDNNPINIRRDQISAWKEISSVSINETINITDCANRLIKKGIKSKDALHVSCAIEAKCDYFITTDKLLLSRLIDFNDIQVINPTNFISLLEDENI